MKKNDLINKLFLALTLSVTVLACSDDEGGGSTVSFTKIATTTSEADAETVTIPLRNGSVTEEDITWGGTATEGEDYTVAGITDEGIQITIINDDDLEPNETIRLQISSSDNGTHVVNIMSDCGDTENVYAKYFEGDWDAIEYYCGVGETAGTCDYGPYHQTWTQDSEDPTVFRTANFYDSGRTGFIKFDFEAETVYFPDQQPLPDAGAPTLLTGSSGTFTLDECDGSTMTIELDYDGGVWHLYLERPYPTY